MSHKFLIIRENQLYYFSENSVNVWSKFWKEIIVRILIIRRISKRNKSSKVIMEKKQKWASFAYFFLPSLKIHKGILLNCNSVKSLLQGWIMIPTLYSTFAMKFFPLEVFPSQPLEFRLSDGTSFFTKGILADEIQADTWNILLQLDLFCCASTMSMSICPSYPARLRNVRLVG